MYVSTYICMKVDMQCMYISMCICVCMYLYLLACPYIQRYIHIYRHACTLAYIYE